MLWIKLFALVCFGAKCDFVKLALIHFEGNFQCVGLSVCLSVCRSVCLCVSLFSARSSVLQHSYLRQKNASKFSRENAKIEPQDFLVKKQTILSGDTEI